LQSHSFKFNYSDEDWSGTFFVCDEHLIFDLITFLLVCTRAQLFIINVLTSASVMIIAHCFVRLASPLSYLTNSESTQVFKPSILYSV
jgi:hypothetical protein